MYYFAAYYFNAYYFASYTSGGSGGVSDDSERFGPRGGMGLGVGILPDSLGTIS